MNKVIEALLSEIKALAKGKNPVKVELAEVTFSDGRIGRYEGETLEKGTKLELVDAEGLIPADGEFEVEKTGAIIVVEAGIVKSITDVSIDPKLNLSKEQIIKITSEQVAEDLKAFKKEYTDKFEVQKKEIEDLKKINKKQSEFNTIVANTPIVDPTLKPNGSTDKSDWLSKYEHVNN